MKVYNIKLTEQRTGKKYDYTNYKSYGKVIAQANHIEKTLWLKNTEDERFLKLQQEIKTLYPNYAT